MAQRSTGQLDRSAALGQAQLISAGLLMGLCLLSRSAGAWLVLGASLTCLVANEGVRDN